MHESPPLLALTLPLQGRQLIEASAGTGKTWTLAALYVRVVLGHGRGGLDQGLLPPQILVMTFTEAATAEFGRHVRCVDAGGDRLPLDLCDEFVGHRSQALDFLLVRHQFLLGERAHGVDDHLLFFAEFELHGGS